MVIKRDERLLLNPLKEEDFVNITPEVKAKHELEMKYGYIRYQTENPYDYLDLYNVEVNLPEIGNIYIFLFKFYLI